MVWWTVLCVVLAWFSVYLLLYVLWSSCECTVYVYLIYPLFMRKKVAMFIAESATHVTFFFLYLSSIQLTKSNVVVNLYL